MNHLITMLVFFLVQLMLLGNQKTVWEAKYQSQAYKEATAHNPAYHDRDVWPEWVNATDFVKEQWPKTRVLVWAHSGKSLRGVDLNDPANWLEDGKPASKGPDAQTDVIFMGGSNGKPTFVGSDKICSVRHMTIEAGAGGFVSAIKIHGNLWIKKGGQQFLQLLPAGGGLSTFMRNDNRNFNGQDTKKVYLVANKIALNKPANKSVEWIGEWRLGDELDLFSGMFILAPDSVFLAGDRSTQHIYPQGKLILLSGSTFQKRGNQYWGNEMEIVGELWAGTPTRPLLKDCHLGISFKAKGKFRLSHPEEKGIILYREGRIAVYSADPQKARLVFYRNRLPAESHRFPDGKESPEVAAMPHGIDMLLLGRVEWNGVVLNDILKGGILIPDLNVRNSWQNIFFGEGNFGQKDELFAKYTGPLDLKMKDSGIAGDLVRKGIKPGEE